MRKKIREITEVEYLDDDGDDVCREPAEDAEPDGPPPEDEPDGEPPGTSDGEDEG